MPTIKLTDDFGLVVDASPPPNTTSLFSRYLKSPEAITAVLRNPRSIKGIQVGQDPFTSQSVGVAFSEPVNLGDGGVGLTIKPRFAGSLEITKGQSLFGSDDDPFGDSVTIPEPARQAFVSAGIEASLAVGLTEKTGNLQFGFTTGTDITFTNHRLFSLTDEIATAIQALFQNFVIPGDLRDVESMLPGTLATVQGVGSLKFCVQTDLLCAVNPLAAVSTSVFAGALKIVDAGAELTAGATYTLKGEYQLRVHRLAGRRFRLGYEKKRDADLEVSVAADVGVSAGLGGFDLIQRLLQAISADPVPDKNAFHQAGLGDEQIAVIAVAVKAGIERCLQISLTGELSALDGVSAAFSYEIDLDALDPKGTQAVSEALGGDLSALESSRLAGVTPLKSIFSTIRQRKQALKINLLGIFNYGSATPLLQKGTLIVDRETGDITITDQAGANRIEFTSDNFARDSAKLRKILAESFLMTAAYRTSGTVRQGPQLKSKYWFCELQQKTDIGKIKDYFNIIQALGVIPGNEVPGKLQAVGAGALGVSTFYLDAEYDDPLFKLLFLDAAGRPRAQSEYEEIGRNALLALLPPGDSVNDARRLPLSDPPTWRAMKAAGQPNNFGGLFANRNFNANQLADITSDYTLISWWAAAMRDMGVALAGLLSYMIQNPQWKPEDDTFKKHRSNLQDTLASVAENTKPQFAEPWGLLAMDLASGQKAATKVRLNCSRLTLSQSRGGV